VATIGSRFTYHLGDVVGHGIPQALPRFALPWNVPNPGGGAPGLSYDMVASLMPSAFAITMLGAIESLLSAVVADGMAQTKHDPDAELVALGIGNILCPFFGGIAATGAIARTATNIRFGARSPLSAVIHACFTLLVIFLFAPYVSFLPMAALAALLMLVAYNMSELKHFGHIVRVAPKSDVAVLLMCFGLTVVFDMVVGVSVGVVLAALLFMRRMASVTSSHRFLEHNHPRLREPLPKSVLLYEIAGPLFFGAAERAVEAMTGITDDIRAVIFWVDEVPVMDVTGLVAFESAVRKLEKHHRDVLIVGLKPQPANVLRKAGLLSGKGAVTLFPNLDAAVTACRVKYAPASASAPTPAGP
jgi:SulP family sulfate permease